MRTADSMPGRKTAIKPRLTFVDVIAIHAEQTPEATALRDPSGSLTFRETWAAVQSVSAWLRQQGIRPGDRVATALPASAAHLIVLLAAMASGAVAAPLNIKLSRPELRGYLATIEPSLVLAGTEQEALLQGWSGAPVRVLAVRERSGGALALFESLSLSVLEPDHGPVDVDPLAPAIVFGTGGTTGSPKAAAWSHQALWLYGAACAIAMEDRRTDLELFFSPFFHIALVTGPFGTLFAGGAVHALPEFDAGTVAEILAQGEVTRFFGAPTALLRVIEAPGFDPSRMERVRRVLFGSTRSEPDLPERLAKAFPHAEFITGYGATEYGAVIRLRSWEFDATQELGVGKAVPGVSVLIVDPEGAVLPVGAIGELVICAPWQMLGYWGHGERESSNTFIHGGVRSGDLGELDAAGTIHLRGRLKDIVITGGENVFPVEVEDVLSAHDAVAEVAVVGVLDPVWGERVEAAIILAPGVSSPAATDLQAFCRERLAAYKVPKRFHFVDGLPLTSAMKVDKRALRERLTDA